MTITITEKFESQFFTEIVELDGDLVKYIFDKKKITKEKIAIVEETYNKLYDDEIVEGSFDEYLDTLGIEYINIGTLSNED